MTRVSQLELYNDKDIITQICALKNLVATGTYSAVSAVRDGGDIVFTFTDRNGDDSVFAVSVDEISDITSSQSGSTVILNFVMAGGEVHTVTFTATGGVTLDTAQTVTGVKTFTVSPIVPTTPDGVTGAVNLSYVESTVDGVNNLMHKSGRESVPGEKTWTGKQIYTGVMPSRKRVTRNPGADNQWTKLWEFNRSTVPVNAFIFFDAYANRDTSYLKMYVQYQSSTVTIRRLSASGYPTGTVAVSIDADGNGIIWMRTFDGSARLMAEIEYECTVNFKEGSYVAPSSDEAGYPQPQAEDYDILVIA